LGCSGDDLFENYFIHRVFIILNSFLRFPVRALGMSFDGKYLAHGNENSMDIVSSKVNSFLECCL
jgi:hypothetical protein